MSNPALENKILQLFLLSCDVSPPIVREYFEQFILQGHKKQNFHTFLKDKHNKHVIVHLHYNRVKCCMKKCKLSRQSVIKVEQFETLYHNVTGCVPHQKKNGDTVTKHCVCLLEPVDSLDHIDLSLMWILLYNFFKNSMCHVGFVKIIKDVRNYVCHLPSLSAVSEKEIDDKLALLTRTLDSLSAFVPGKMIQAAVKKQIEYVRMGTFKAEDVDKIIKGGKEHTDVKILEIIEKIEVFSRELQDHTTKLATDIIQDGQENKKHVVENIKNSREYVTEVVIECREQEKEQLEEIQVAQRMVIDTQSAHGETIERIDNTAMETHKETVEQTEMITKIKEDVTGLEHLDERMPTKEDVVNISSLNEKIKGHADEFENILQRYKETQTGMHTLNADTQPGIESLQYELYSTPAPSVDDTTLNEGRQRQNDTGRALLDNINNDLDTLIKTTTGKLESIEKMHEETLYNISNTMTMAQDKETMTKITMEREVKDLRDMMHESFTSLLQGVADAEMSLKLCKDDLQEIKRDINLSDKKSGVDDTALKTLLTEGRQQQNDIGRALLDNINNDLDTLIKTTAGKLESIEKMHEETLYNISNTMTMAQDKETMTKITMEREVKDFRDMMHESFTSLSQGVADAEMSLKLCKDDLQEIKSDINLSDKKSVKHIDQQFEQSKALDEDRALRYEERLHVKLKEITDTCARHVDDMCNKLAETVFTISRETVKQITERIEKKIDEKIISPPPDNSSLAEKYDSRKKQRKQMTDRAKYTRSPQTSLETDGYQDDECISLRLFEFIKSDGEEFNFFMGNGTMDEDAMELLLKCFVYFPKIIELMIKICQNWVTESDGDAQRTWRMESRRTNLSSPRVYFTEIAINMQEARKKARGLWSSLEPLMSLINSETPQERRLDAIHKVVTLIVDFPLDIVELSSKNEEQAIEFILGIQRYVYRKLPMEFEETCRGIVLFFKSFVFFVKSLRNKIYNLGKESQRTVSLACSKCRYLITASMCKQAYDISTDVSMVICICNSYLKISKTILMPMMETYENVLSKPKEEFFCMDLTVLENKEEMVSAIVAKHKKRMKKHIATIFAQNTPNKP